MVLPDGLARIEINQEVRQGDCVVIFDNAPNSLGGLRERLESVFDVSVHKTIGAFANRVMSIRKKGGRIAFVVLDMHDDRVPNLADIELEEVDTHKGTAVGLALAQFFLWDVGRGLGTIPVLIFTAKQIPEIAAEVIGELKSDGKPIDSANKRDDVDEVLEKVHDFKPVDFSLDVPLSYDELIQSFQALSERARDWGFSDGEIVKMFGYDPDNNKSVDSLFEWMAKNPSMDHEKRIYLHADIQEGVNTILPEGDIEGQVNWLNQKQEKFENQTSKQLLTSRKIDDLLRLTYYLRDRVR